MICETVDVPQTNLSFKRDEQTNHMIATHYSDKTGKYYHIAYKGGLDKQAETKLISKLMTTEEAVCTDEPLSKQQTYSIMRAFHPTDYSTPSSLEFSFSEQDTCADNPTFVLQPEPGLLEHTGYHASFRHVLDSSGNNVGKMLFKQTEPRMFALELHSPVAGLPAGTIAASMHDVHSLHFSKDKWHAIVRHT